MRLPAGLLEPEPIGANVRAGSPRSRSHRMASRAPMRFDIVTLFPGFFESTLRYGILERALRSGLASVSIHDLRNFTHDRHRTVDDRPFGGGEGMVLKPEPIFECVESLGNHPQTHPRHYPRIRHPALRRRQALHPGHRPPPRHTRPRRPHLRPLRRRRRACPRTPLRRRALHRRLRPLRRRARRGPHPRRHRPPPPGRPRAPGLLPLRELRRARLRQLPADARRRPPLHSRLRRPARLPPLHPPRRLPRHPRPRRPLLRRPRHHTPVAPPRRSRKNVRQPP